jgi:hypothetical protein
LTFEPKRSNCQSSRISEDVIVFEERRNTMGKRVLAAMVLCLALSTLIGCYGEEPYADKKKAQEEAKE